MDFDLKEVMQMMSGVQPFQVNIGCNSGNVCLPEPSRQKIIDLIHALRPYTNVKLKTNSSRILGDLSLI